MSEKLNKLTEVVKELLASGDPQHVTERLQSMLTSAMKHGYQRATQSKPTQENQSNEELKAIKRMTEDTFKATQRREIKDKLDNNIKKYIVELKKDPQKANQIKEALKSSDPQVAETIKGAIFGRVTEKIQPYVADALMKGVLSNIQPATPSQPQFQNKNEFEDEGRQTQQLMQHQPTQAQPMKASSFNNSIRGTSIAKGNKMIPNYNPSKYSQGNRETLSRADISPTEFYAREGIDISSSLEQAAQEKGYI